MRQAASVTPSNSILFTADGTDGDVPVVSDMSLPAWATPTCIIVRCFPEVDGPTEVIFGPRDQVDPGTLASGTYVLRTPRRQVQVSEVGDEVVFEATVASDITRVSVWLSHPRWPDKVIIGLD